jgi:hypothetical protein
MWWAVKATKQDVFFVYSDGTPNLFRGAVLGGEAWGFG